MYSHLTPCGAACRPARGWRVLVAGVLPVAVCSCLLVMASSLPALANPFDELPPDHWAYAALAELTRLGVLDEVPVADNTVRPLTRYEISLMVAKALSRVIGTAGEAAGVRDGNGGAGEAAAFAVSPDPPEAALNLLARLEAEFRPELRLLVGGARGVSELARAANNVTDIHEIKSPTEPVVGSEAGRGPGVSGSSVPGRAVTGVASSASAWTGTIGEALVLGASYVKTSREELDPPGFVPGSGGWPSLSAGAAAGTVAESGASSGALGAALRLADGVWLQGWYSQDSSDGTTGARTMGLRTTVDLGWMNLDAGATLLVSDAGTGSERESGGNSGAAGLYSGRLTPRALAGEPDDVRETGLPLDPGVEPGGFTFDVSTKVKLSDLVSVGAKYDRTRSGSLASTTTGIDVSVKADKGAEISLGQKITESSTDPSADGSSIRELVTSLSLRYPFKGDASVSASYSSANVSGERVGGPLELRERAALGVDYSPLSLSRAVLTAGLSYETVRDYIASTIVSTRTASTGLDYSLSEGHRLYAGYSVSDSGPSGTTTTASLGFGYSLTDWAQLSIGYKMVDFFSGAEEQDRVNMATAELSIRF